MAGKDDNSTRNAPSKTGKNPEKPGQPIRKSPIAANEDTVPETGSVRQETPEKPDPPQGDDRKDDENSSNHLPDEDLPDLADDLQGPQIEGFLEEKAQLSASEGVPEDMGTIALERVLGEGQKAQKIPLPLVTGAAGLDQLTDAEIMQRVGAGDDTCFDYLIAKYRRPIIGFMYRMIHNQAVAEELAQEVFLRVYRARQSYRAEARFTTWLYRIAANTAINHARDSKYERAASNVYLDQADEETGTSPDVADARPLAEQSMLRDERMARIRQQVMALPERQRMAVIMHKFQDMDYKQIGSVLKLSESATKSLLFRAYQTLRERLKEFA